MMQDAIDRREENAVKLQLMRCDVDKAKTELQIEKAKLVAQRKQVDLDLKRLDNIRKEICGLLL